MHFLLKRLYVILCAVVLGITTPFYSEKITSFRVVLGPFYSEKMHSVATGSVLGVIATECLAHLHPGRAQGDAFP